MKPPLVFVVTLGAVGALAAVILFVLPVRPLLSGALVLTAFLCTTSAIVLRRAW